MSKYNRDPDNLFDDPEEDLDAQPYRVAVEFVIKAENHDAAERKIHELIKEGILMLATNDEEKLEYPYDIVSVTVADVDFD